MIRGLGRVIVAFDQIGARSARQMVGASAFPEAIVGISEASTMHIGRQLAARLQLRAGLVFFAAKAVQRRLTPAISRPVPRRP